MRLDLSGKESYLSAAVAKRGESKRARASVLFDDWIRKSYKRRHAQVSIECLPCT